MSIKELIETLHPLERKVLPILKEDMELKKIIEKTKLKDVEAMRALQWLQNKDVLKIKQDLKEVISLDKNGEEYIKTGLPETKFLKSLTKELNFNEIKEKANLTDEEFNISLGLLKREDLIQIKNNKIKITEKGKSLKESKEEFLRKLPLETKDLGNKLIKEKIPDNFIDTLTTNILKTNSWKGKKFRRYDIKINVPKIYPAKRHFVNQSIEYAKRIWLDLGFKEMQGSKVQIGFWNFDALFTAQDHPVRDIQDTYYIKNFNGKLPSKDIVERIKKTHENGWTTGSKGWQYSWDEKEAKKNVLRTHTTCLSAETLSKLKESDIPAKFFSVGKNFRNETMDFSHGFELNQSEGIVIDKNANFKHLLGYLRAFANKMGYGRVRFRPAYFPYTEPSVEGDVYDSIRKKWIEVIAAGIFRPEVVKPLLGKDIPVLAWGNGLDRMAMGMHGIKDIRDLYKNDLKQMKNMKLWLK
ncbi:MAG: phenylalanine--tRNA ligase subunit alpha [Candidatus Nanoarchaeia archaeon]|nr:phenylalanine--tRNA ligase subunit alpha [Candidatus Nanoarchaeia archaeon]